MSALNQNWDRWIKGSVTKTLRAACDAAKLPFFVEGGDRMLNMAPAAVEMRMDGPNWDGLVQDIWKGYFTINVICECIKGQDLFSQNKMTGLIASTMASPFKIYKVGQLPGDDANVLVACTNQVGRIKVRPFGLVKPTVDLLQATVEAQYTVILP